MWPRSRAVSNFLLPEDATLGFLTHFYSSAGLQIDRLLLVAAQQGFLLPKRAAAVPLKQLVTLATSTAFIHFLEHKSSSLSLSLLSLSLLYRQVPVQRPAAEALVLPPPRPGLAQRIRDSWEARKAAQV